MNLEELLSKKTPWQRRVEILDVALGEYFTPDTLPESTRTLADALGDNAIAALLTRYGKYEPLRKYAFPFEIFVNSKNVRCLRRSWAHPDIAERMRRESEEEQSDEWKLWEEQCAAADEHAKSGSTKKTKDLTARGGDAAALEDRVKKLEEQLDRMGEILSRIDSLS